MMRLPTPASFKDAAVASPDGPAPTMMTPLKYVAACWESIEATTSSAFRIWFCRIRRPRDPNFAHDSSSSVSITRGAILMDHSPSWWIYLHVADGCLTDDSIAPSPLPQCFWSPFTWCCRRWCKYNDNNLRLSCVYLRSILLHPYIDNYLISQIDDNVALGLSMWWEFDSDESTWQVSTLEEEIVETKNYNLLKVKDIWLYIFLSIYGSTATRAAWDDAPTKC